MATPRDLISKVLRPVKEPDAPTLAPPVPDVRERIVRREFHPDGSVTVFEFIAGKGETKRTIPADELTAPDALTDAQREGVRAEAALHD
jgi:hypothetical protein